MKVLLAATNREPFPYAVAPLGALCVAAAARAAGHEVDFLDLRMPKSPHQALESALKAKDYQVVAFGIRNLDNCWAFAHALISTRRAASPKPCDVASKDRWSLVAADSRCRRKVGCGGFRLIAA